MDPSSQGAGTSQKWQRFPPFFSSAVPYLPANKGPALIYCRIAIPGSFKKKKRKKKALTLKKLVCQASRSCVWIYKSHNCLDLNYPASPHHSPYGPHPTPLSFLLHRPPPQLPGGLTAASFSISKRNSHPSHKTRRFQGDPGREQEHKRTICPRVIWEATQTAAWREEKDALASAGA